MTFEILDSTLELLSLPTTTTFQACLSLRLTMDAAPEASTSAAAGAIDDVALPLFKKRSNRPGAASKRRLASEDRFADVGADGGASTPEAEGTDDEPAGCVLFDA